MKNPAIDRDGELRDIVDERLAALVLELEKASWPTEDIATAIHDVLRTRWLDSIDALRKAKAATSNDFLSDGNEG